MIAASSKSLQRTLWASDIATSSPEPAAAPSRANLQAGPTTANCGAADSLAPASARPAKGKGSKINKADSGGLGSGSLPRDDRFGCSLRTALCSELAAMTGSPLRWKESATPANRPWWVLSMPEARKSDCASGSCADWPTINAAVLDHGGTTKTGDRESGAKRQVSITDAVLQADWATPVARPAGGTPEQFLERKRKAVAKGCEMGICLSDLGLQVEVADWSTPKASEMDRGVCESEMNRRSPSLQAEAREADWPTATICGNHNRKGASEQSGDGLATAVTNAAGPPLDSLTPTETRSPAHSTNGSRPGPLNAAWVAVLMGYPSDWGDDATKPASSS